MRKIFIAVMLVFVLASVCYGAETEDMSMYVRKDVYNSDMRNINDKLDRILDELKSQRDELKSQREELKALRQDLNNLAQVVANLAGRVDGLEKRMESIESRMGRLEQSIDNRFAEVKSDTNNRFNELRNDIYLGLVILGIIAGLPSVKSFLQWNATRKPSFTLDDVKLLVKELIEENNAKLQANSMNIAR